MIDVNLLGRICEIPGAPGHENAIRNFLIKELEAYCDTYEIDALGNLILFKKGQTNQRLLLAAHMDEIGFMVSHVDSKGFIRFQPLGGFDPKTLSSQRVWIHGIESIMGVMGSKPIHIMSADERQKAPKIEDFFIDTGLSADAVHKYISVGDVITREGKLIEMGECVNAKSLDNRVSVYIMLELIKRIHDRVPAYDTYFVFTVQEEVGLRGAEAVSSRINPHFALAIDTTIAYDLPNSQDHEYITQLGGGIAIKYMDARTICDQRMVQFLKKTAQKHKIVWQTEVLPMGGTDTAALQRAGDGGSIAGALSVATRHIHQTIEMCHKSDILAGIDLLEHSLLSMNTGNWQL